jgi:hypothetical protein
VHLLALLSAASLLLPSESAPPPSMMMPWALAWQVARPTPSPTAVSVAVQGGWASHRPARQFTVKPNREGRKGGGEGGRKARRSRSTTRRMRFGAGAVSPAERTAALADAIPRCAVKLHPEVCREIASRDVNIYFIRRCSENRRHFVVATTKSHTITHTHTHTHHHSHTHTITHTHHHAHWHASLR